MQRTGEGPFGVVRKNNQVSVAVHVKAVVLILNQNESPMK